jgi:hypothetical protein
VQFVSMLVSLTRLTDDKELRYVKHSRILTFPADPTEVPVSSLYLFAFNAGMLADVIKRYPASLAPAIHDLNT